MAKVKKKRKSVKGQDGLLESVLRFEIIVALFALIGFYYFLSFSPIRMPKEPITSPRLAIALLPPSSETLVPIQEEGVVEDESVSADSESSSATAAQEGLEPGVSESHPCESVVAMVLSVGSENLKVAPSPERVAQASLPVESQKVEPQKIENQKFGLSKPVKNQVLKTSSPNSPQPSSALAVATVESVVAVGDYVLRSDLKNARTQLESLGFTVKSEVKKIPTPMYRVYLGPFSNRQEIQKMMTVVRKMGDQPFIQKGVAGDLVVIGSFYLEESVVAWENMYHDAGLDPKVRQENLLISHTQLLLDGSQVNPNPEAVLARVRAAGFSNANLKTNPSTQTISPTSAK